MAVGKLRSPVIGVHCLTVNFEPQSQMADTDRFHELLRSDTTVDDIRGNPEQWRITFVDIEAKDVAGCLDLVQWCFEKSGGYAEVV